MATHLPLCQTPPDFRHFQPLPSPPMSSTLSKVKPMAVQTLLTPPNSQDIKVFHDFEQREHDDARRDRVLFSPSKEPASPSPLQLFASTAATRSPLHVPTRGTTDFQPSSLERYVIRSWASQDTPHWEAFEEAGITRPAGVHTWEDLRRRERAYGSYFQKPTEEEYNIVAGFFKEMRTWRGPPHESIPRKPRSKVTKPSLVHRTGSNGHAGTPSLAKAMAVTTASPRRASRTNHTKFNAKSSVSEAKSARAPSSKPAKDPEWRNYPDYAPKDEYMDMKVAFAAAHDAKNFAEHKKGFDLAEDPERQHLNEAELSLCERLALDCHRFLTSKRQIFEGYVGYLQRKNEIEDRIRAGLEERGRTRLPSWNKTAAQSLMGIDVTKGSYIWAFYNEVGFFDEKYFQQHARRTTPSA